MSLISMGAFGVERGRSIDQIAAGRAYKCAEPGCENRVLGFGDRCCVCIDEDEGLTVVRSVEARKDERRQARREWVRDRRDDVLVFLLCLREWEREYGWIFGLILFVVCASAIAYSWGAAFLCGGQ
jgi:hypothetical protein